MGKACTCIICGKEKRENLILFGKHICAECEWTILKTRPHEEGYKRCTEGLKKVISK